MRAIDNQDVFLVHINKATSCLTKILSQIRIITAISLMAVISIPVGQ